MAKIVRVGDEIVLELSFFEKLGALHSSPRASADSIAKVEFVDQLWGSSTLRGIRAPGTALPYVVLLGTLRGRGYRDFVAMKGRGVGAVITFKSGPFERWIFTLKQPAKDISELAA
ncbi:hypothetical protein MCEMRE130_01173 [Candidatus Nanopelagicaceae bacterium]